MRFGLDKSELRFPSEMTSKMYVKGNGLGMLVVAMAVMLIMYEAFTLVSSYVPSAGQAANGIFWLIVMILVGLFGMMFMGLGGSASVRR